MVGVIRLVHIYSDGHGCIVLYILGFHSVMIVIISTPYQSTLVPAPRNCICMRQEAAGKLCWKFNYWYWYTETYWYVQGICT